MFDAYPLKLSIDAHIALSFESIEHNMSAEAAFKHDINSVDNCTDTLLIVFSVLSTDVAVEFSRCTILSFN